MTSPASGASSAADLPDYAPIPRSALGPALNEHQIMQSLRLDSGPSGPVHP